MARERELDPGSSVFGEMLTFRSLLDTAPPEERRTMLAAKVEDMLNTVVRQIAFYSFERKVHLERDRKSTRLNSSHSGESRMPSSA